MSFRLCYSLVYDRYVRYEHIARSFMNHDVMRSCIDVTNDRKDGKQWLSQCRVGITQRQLNPNTDRNAFIFITNQISIASLVSVFVPFRTKGWSLKDGRASIVSD